MKIIETRPREIGFVLWDHCQNLLDDPRIIVLPYEYANSKEGESRKRLVYLAFFRTVNDLIDTI